MQRLFFILIIVLVSGCAQHTPAPVRDSSLKSSPSAAIHRVIPGDTLYSIAWRYNLKYEDLARHNAIKPPYLIKPSQQLRLDVSAARASAAVPSTVPAKPSKGSSKTVQAPASRQKNQSAKVAKPPLLHNKVSTQQWYWPATGPILSGFQGNGGLNKGIDIGGKLGEPVLAAASGQVVYAGSGLRGYGKLLIIKHNDTFLSAYAHCDRLLVQEGGQVKAGQRIADIGSSGTDRVKLHFEIRREGVPVNPSQYLPPR